MSQPIAIKHAAKAGTLLSRLARDKSGNTIAIVAASIAPVLALVGGGIDMGRSYLSESRLQAACDAGVLAARKKLGATVPGDGLLPSDADAVGKRFFDVNFRNGAYGTTGLDFDMQLETDMAVSGVAQVIVPTTIMKVFGEEQVPLSRTCEARLNFTNTDIMFVLDTTASMNETNSGDPVNRISALRQVVKDFSTTLDTASVAGTRIRYGFVPYATNVNVGALLDDSWVVNEWDYQSREVKSTKTDTGTNAWTANWTLISGADDYAIVESTYAATWHPPTVGSSTTSGELGTTSGGGSPGYYTCDTAAPASTLVTSEKTKLSSVDEPYAGPPVGTKTTVHWTEKYNGDSYGLALVGSNCEVRVDRYDDAVFEYDYITTPTESTTTTFRYDNISRDVSLWRTESNGCMEERDTYEIDDYSSVDFSRALDLDIDTVPSPGDEDTQWRPMYPNIIYERELAGWNDAANFKTGPSDSTGTYFQPASLPSLVACPSAAQKLEVMTPAEVGTYVDSMITGGSTYHDIGMIWGGRLISPTGLFADDNEDEDGQSTSRNLIFLTDGMTETFDIAYGAYGVEPLDRRRWDPVAPKLGLSLDQVVEQRFAVACDEVKKKNVTVWVISFGVAMTPLMQNCAGPGRSFQANDAAELNDAFSKIAKSLGDLRVSK